MKNIIAPLLSYFIICIIVILSSASEGYDVVSWKLFVGQIFAIPVLIVVALVTFYVNKKQSRKK